jgi:hypothetical protein
MRRTMMGLLAMWILMAGAGKVAAAEAVREGAAADSVPGLPDIRNASLALGYHNVLAPLGGRFWFAGQKYGMDFGAGYKFDEQTLQDGSGHVMATLTLDIGFPISVRRWEKLRFIARPGIVFQSIDTEIGRVDVNQEILPSDVAKFYSVGARGEIEVEYFLVNRLSASAGYGAQYLKDKLDYPGSASRGSSESFGGNLFEVGFHLYIWSGK